MRNNLTLTLACLVAGLTSGTARADATTGIPQQPTPATERSTRSNPRPGIAGADCYRFQGGLLFTRPETPDSLRCASQEWLVAPVSPDIMTQLTARARDFRSQAESAASEPKKEQKKAVPSGFALRLPKDGQSGPVIHFLLLRNHEDGKAVCMGGGMIRLLYTVLPENEGEPARKTNSALTIVKVTPAEQATHGPGASAPAAVEAEEGTKATEEADSKPAKPAGKKKLSPEEHRRRRERRQKAETPSDPS